MKIYKIEFKKQVEKFLDSRTSKERKQLLALIYKLPNGVHNSKMEGYKNRYRLRVGSVRVIYEVYDDLLIILILKIDNRGDVYKK